MHGAEIKINGKIRPDCFLFGETQARVIVSVNKSDIDKLRSICESKKVKAEHIGFVGGHSLAINKLLNVSLKDMKTAYYESLPRFLSKA